MKVGESVLQDYKLAHMWFNIAAENRELLAKKITSSQIEKAQDMARASGWLNEGEITINII